MEGSIDSEAPKTTIESAEQLINLWIKNKVELKENYIPSEFEKPLDAAQRLYVNIKGFTKETRSAFEVNKKKESRGIHLRK